jgi:hypothetical protein
MAEAGRQRHSINADNWVTTSMGLNSAKSNFTLDELRWTLLPPGELSNWDGSLRWFLAFISPPEHLADSYIKTWHSAAKRMAGMAETQHIERAQPPSVLSRLMTVCGTAVPHFKH